MRTCAPLPLPPRHPTNHPCMHQRPPSTTTRSSSEHWHAPLTLVPHRLYAPAAHHPIFSPFSSTAHTAAVALCNAHKCTCAAAGAGAACCGQARQLSIKEPCPAVPCSRWLGECYTSAAAAAGHVGGAAAAAQRAASHNGVGRGGHTGPQVRALLAHGAGDGRACTAAQGSVQTGGEPTLRPCDETRVHPPAAPAAQRYFPSCSHPSPLSTQPPPCTPEPTQHSPFISPLVLTITPALSSK